MAYAMEAAAANKLDFYVLDRPDPITASTVQGAVLDDDLTSFITYLPLPVRHGMTLGELARLFNAEKNIGVRLHVVTMRRYERTMWFDQTGFAWVPPSPNLRKLEQAVLYPAVGMIEAANVSVGRGTDSPFELVGAPWIDGRALREALEAERLPGVRFRDVSFRPMFHKWAGESCGGVQLHVTDREAFRPFLTGIAVVRAARAQVPSRIVWRSEVYEFVSDRLAFDLLAGNSLVRSQVEEGTPLAEIEASWQAELAAFEARRAEVLLY